MFGKRSAKRTIPNAARSLLRTKLSIFLFGINVNVKAFIPNPKLHAKCTAKIRIARCFRPTQMMIYMNGKKRKILFPCKAIQNVK